MICPNCGHDNPAEADSCASCGDPLVVEEASPAVTAVPYRRRMLVTRMVRAAMFNGQLYNELQDDTTATIQAFAVVVMSSVSFALSWATWIAPLTEQDARELLLPLITWSFTSAVIGWVLLSLLAYWGGSRVMRRKLTLPIVLRATGFGSAPAVLWVLGFAGRGFVLVLNPVIVLWVVLSMMVALNHTLQIGWVAGLWLSMTGFIIAIMILRLLATPFL